MNRDREFTPAEIQHMKMAGIPADREGLLSEYPLMMYRKGENTEMLYGEPFGRMDVVSMTVFNEDEELIASEQGWSRKVPGEEEAKRGPGRPKAVDA